MIWLWMVIGASFVFFCGFVIGANVAYAKVMEMREAEWRRRNGESG